MQIGYAPEAIEICPYDVNSDCIVIRITNILKCYNKFLPLKLNCIQEDILFFDM